MNFEFSDEQRSLQRELRSFLSDAVPLSRVRTALETGEGTDVEIWKELGELGWLGIAVPETQGGSGLGALELALAAEEMGRVLAPVPFSSSICCMAWALNRHGGATEQTRWLPGLSTGAEIGTLALAEKAGPLEPARLHSALRDGRLSGVKLAVADGSVATVAIVACVGDAELALVDLDQPGVTRRPRRSIDPSRAVADIHFDSVEAVPLGAIGAVEELLLESAVFAAFEQIGGADAVFAMTREFLGFRQAFGRPIASYQALKHRMADLYAAIELARSNAYYAAWALSAGSSDFAEAASCARIAASQAYELATVEAIQLHGGIGFTWESDCHLFYRRAKWLSTVLGSPDEWRERLVRSLDLLVA